MPRRVLVIDDESAMRFTLEAVLGDAGFDVHTADGGAAGIADFEAHGADVVLTDLAMPEVDGRRPIRTRLLDDYVRRVQLAAHHDPVVARAFMRVANLTDPPSTLLAPRLMVRALAQGSR